MSMSLMCSPVFDQATEYSREWSKEVEEIIPNLTVMEGKPFTRREVELELEGKRLFIFYGHGGEDCLYGSPDEKVVDLKNIDKLPKETYTMACSSAKKLGVEVWRSGRMFWGYIEPFIFTTDSLSEFKQFANNGIKLYSKGSTWSTALEETKKLGRELSTMLSNDGRFIASIAMWEDAENLRLYDEYNYPKESTCILRRIAIKLFGSRGWAMRRIAIRWAISRKRLRV
jgi:hypothetical protein